MDSISQFVDLLAKAPSFDDVTNQYSFTDPANSIRRANLAAYLSMLQKERPTTILISEAPGYNGMRRTGVPFTSERLITHHPFFGSGAFGVVNAEDVKPESSATIVWSVLDCIDTKLLMWPAFPFHPHKPGNINSNRPPTRAELEYGQQFIRDLISMFGISTRIAVGRHAEKSLSSLGFDPVYVRHPSQGGAKEFRSAILKLFPVKNASAF